MPTITIEIQKTTTYHRAVDVEDADMYFRDTQLEAFLYTAMQVAPPYYEYKIIAIENPNPHPDDMWVEGSIVIRKSSNLDDWYSVVPPRKGTWEDWCGIACQILGIPKYTIEQSAYYVPSDGRRLAIREEGGAFCGYSPRNDNEYAEGSLADWISLAKNVLNIKEENANTD